MRVKVFISTILLIIACSFAEAQLISRWNCDETVGSTVLADSVGGVNGTLTGARFNFVPSGAGIADRNFGNALWTDNLNDYVNLGDAGSLDFGRNDFTITGWFKTNNAARHGLIIRNGASDQGGYAVFIFKNDGRLGFQVYGPSANKLILSDNTFNDDNWHWFGASVSGLKLYLYVDGKKQSQSGLVFDSQTTATAAAGLTASIDRDMAGSVDEICIYNSALSASVDASMNLTGGELYDDWVKLPSIDDCNDVIAAGHGIPADINKDCKVDFKDLAMFGEKWLQTHKMEIPVFWKKPVTFHSGVSGLGLQQLDGITHSYVYGPLASSACISEGGNGYYESLLHGTYNHHPQIIMIGNKFIVYWTNHAKDENGPGERILARVGTFDAEMNDIDWNENESFFEIAPQPVLVNRRLYNHNPAQISELFTSGGLKVINGRIYSIGDVLAIHGWTNDPLYHGVQSSPVPLNKWRDSYDSASGFTLDVWWKIGTFYQQWKINGDNLEPNSIMYKASSFKTQIEVTPGNFRPVAALQQPYNNAAMLTNAVWGFRNDVLNTAAEPFSRTAYFTSTSAKRAAADGLNGLAHIAVYQKPDGKWVVVRDNLSNPGYYYAAEIENYNDYCPPAYLTNLYGTAQPDARELPDGRPYIICNSMGRKDMFITVSNDGYIFDKTWQLLHSDRTKSDDGLFKSGGPQYFRSIVVGDNIWVTYSITKEIIGLTKIPVNLIN
ncbi:MAG: hypothetical protein A2Y10_01935 [Planctomycetes bacterium GWF2_41_51]|nr:MAG: hypothetical protein A2Y10_01935 [Planctomycetes bacterium GWF2_41_51]HBG26301.1 hypothetical protein [Phycisphaerales bacterium]